MTAQAWATLTVGMIAGLIAVVTISQRRLADNRKEWWTRFQWALDATYSVEGDRRRDAWAIIDDLVISPLITTTEDGVAMHMTMTRYRGDTDSTSRHEGGES